MARSIGTLLAALLFATGAWANPPVASYIFPAGGQRGKAVPVRVGGLFLHDRCHFELLGPGVQAAPTIHKIKTIWFEGPLLPMPDSQRKEDYPRDMAGEIKIAADAGLGLRSWQLWTSQGASNSLRFVVGDLPEIVEKEIDGHAVAEKVTLPLTINGRIFPREDVDIWSFAGKKGQPITCAVLAEKLGSPLDARLEIRDESGQVLAENDDGRDADPTLHFTPPADGVYQVRIHDITFNGGQAYVYRLSITSGPFIDRVYPLGGRRGSTVEFELGGHGLTKNKATAALPAQAPSSHTHRFDLAGVATNLVALDLDDLPEHLEAEPNNEPGQVKPLTVPAMFNGRIDRPGDVDCWAVAVRKGEPYELAVRAQELGSPLDAILIVEDEAGKQLARGDDLQGDPTVSLAAKSDGVVFVRIASRYRSRGGKAYAYRLRVAPSTPDFRLRFERDDLTVNRGGEVKLKVFVDRLGGINEAITLELAGLPAGFSASGSIPAKKPNGTLTIKADADAAIKPVRVRLMGSAEVEGKKITRQAFLPAPPGVPALDSLLLAPAVPTPFKFVGVYVVRLVPRGTVYRRHYRIERNGFDGPLQVSLADRQARHLQGVTGPVITVPADTSEFDYDVNLPPWLETGRTARVTLMAVGVVKDANGSEHKVSFTSVAQNEQIVIVAEPGRLSVSSARDGLAATPGKQATITLNVKRSPGVKGPVRLELLAPAHLSGISAQPVTVAADQGQVELALKFADDLTGPFNAPVAVRATLLDKGRPVTAQTEIKILPPR